MTQVIKKPRRDCPTVKIEATRVWTKPKSNDAKRRLFSVSPCLGVRAKKKHICSRRLKLGVMNLKLKKCRQAFKVKLMPAKSSRMITVFLTYRMLSAISVTLGQPWSETIKWKISEINNSLVWNCVLRAVLSSVMKSYIVLLCIAREVSHPFVQCPHPPLSQFVAISMIRSSVSGIVVLVFK